MFQLLFGGGGLGVPWHFSTTSGSFSMLPSSGNLLLAPQSLPPTYSPSVTCTPGVLPKKSLLTPGVLVVLPCVFVSEHSYDLTTSRLILKCTSHYSVPYVLVS